MAFCEQCGTKLDDDMFFCPECGTQVRSRSPGAVLSSRLRLVTDSSEEAVTVQSLRAALSAAAADEDEYVKLVPVIPGRDAITLIAFCMNTDADEWMVQVVFNERGDRYDDCFEKNGFSLAEISALFLDYARKGRLPADYPDWARL